MPNMLPPPGLSPQPNVLRFGDLLIEWAPWVPFPIVINHHHLNGTVILRTACPITFRRGEHAVTVPAGFDFDGASIPRWFWWIPGFAPIGLHLWAALLHDWLCEHPEILPRVIADALFADLLLESGVGKRGTVMALAVWAWGLAKTLRRKRTP